MYSLAFIFNPRMNFKILWRRSTVWISTNHGLQYTKRSSDQNVLILASHPAGCLSQRLTQIEGVSACKLQPKCSCYMVNTKKRSKAKTFYIKNWSAISAIPTCDQEESTFENRGYIWDCHVFVTVFTVSRSSRGHAVLIFIMYSL